MESDGKARSKPQGPVGVRQRLRVIYGVGLEVALRSRGRKKACDYERLYVVNLQTARNIYMQPFVSWVISSKDTQSQRTEHYVCARPSARGPTQRYFSRVGSLLAWGVRSRLCFHTWFSFNARSTYPYTICSTFRGMFKTNTATKHRALRMRSVVGSWTEPASRKPKTRTRKQTSIV